MQKGKLFILYTSVGLSSPKMVLDLCVENGMKYIEIIKRRLAGK